MKRNQAKEAEWKSVKKRVFSISSKIYVSVTSDRLNNDSITKLAWACSIRAANPKLWTVDADPDTYNCNCDNDDDDSENSDNDKWTKSTDRAAYEDCNDSSSSINNSIFNFKPPPILGYYRHQQTESDETILT